MDNVLTYLSWAGPQSLWDLVFNVLDSLALSQIVHLELETAFRDQPVISVAQAAKALEGDEEARKVHAFLLRQRLQALQLMGDAPRYKDLLLSDFVDEISREDETQFSAVTLTLENGIKVICYRGTDLTLVGWKEDFNMSFDSPVPAQKAALDYLKRIADKSVAPLILLGHSKGGNLAVYAAVHSPGEVQDRLLKVYTFDGPGLTEEDAQLPGYLRVSGRIRSYLPRQSLVGVIFLQHRPYRVVRSGALSIFQHDVFSWEVVSNQPRFVRRKSLSRHSRMMDKALDQWISGLSLDDRRLFSDTIYQVLTAASDETLGDLVRTDRRKARMILRATQDIPPEVRKGLRKAIGLLLSGTVGGVWDAVVEGGRALLPKRKVAKRLLEQKFATVHHADLKALQAARPDQLHQDSPPETKGDE
jgi:hypothetical protein